MKNAEPLAVARRRGLENHLYHLAMAALLVGAAVLSGMALSYWLPQQSTALVFLVAVLIAAVTFGTVCGTSAALLSFLAYNFFFIEPTYTFTVADPQEVFALSVFLLVAVLTGSIAGRLREQTIAARRYAESIQSLHHFSVTLSGATDLGPILQALVAQAGQAVHGSAVVLLAHAGDLSLSAASPAGQSLDQTDWQAARRAFRRSEIVRAPAAGWPGTKFEFRPLATSRTTVGVLGISPGTENKSVPAETEPVIEAILRHASIAIERTLLAAETAKARAEAEQEQLRSALLSSISHDLRTPLSAIVGAVSSLRQLGSELSPEARADLLAAIEEEAGRLSRFVANLLEMTRLEAGRIDLTSDWIDLADPVRAAIGRARHQLPASDITFAVEPGLPLIRGEAAALEQVVFNLLDNALKYSGAGHPVAIAVGAEGETIKLTITDQGPGIPTGELDRVFEKFYRLRRDDRGSPGTGLGLAICRAIVLGMNGTIHVESPVGERRGTRIVVSLPVAAYTRGTDDDPSERGSA